MPEQGIYLLRILMAAGCGFVIGLERKMRLKEAGIRTHTVVSIGACLIMEISKYGFADTGGNDTSRIAAQIVSGIGFLGAGMILYRREALHGLTTAAGIWTTAGIGMCVGAGLYWLALGCSAILVLFHFALHLPIRLFSGKPRQKFTVVFLLDGDSLKTVKGEFDVAKFTRMRTYRDGGKVKCCASVVTHRILNDEEISAMIERNEAILSVERMEEETGRG